MITGKQIKFFTKEEFDKYPNKNISYKDAKAFINECHTSIGEHIILKDKSGWRLPLNLGFIKILKKQHKGIVTTESFNNRKSKEYNNHTFGYVYTFRWYKNIDPDFDRRRLFEKGLVKYQKKSFNLKMAVRFEAHRANLKRKLAKLLKAGKIDFDAA